MKLSILLLVLTIGAIMTQQPEGYDNVDLEEFYSDIILQDLVDFGAQYIIDLGIDNGSLMDTDYYITQVYSIGKQNLTEQNKINYAFDVMMVDQDGSSIRSNYIISYNPSTNTQEVLTYAYDEDYYTSDFNDVFEDSGEEDLPFGGIELVPIDNQDVDLEWLGDIWFTEDEIVDDKGLIITGNPTSVGIDKFNADSEVQNLFIFGLEEVLEQVIPQEIAVSQFHVNNIFDIKKQVVNGINYIFDTEVENTQGIKIRTTFEVYSQSWTGVLELLSYSYTLTNEDGSIVSGEESFLDF